MEQRRDLLGMWIRPSATPLSLMRTEKGTGNPEGLHQALVRREGFPAPKPREQGQKSRLYIPILPRLNPFVSSRPFIAFIYISALVTSVCQEAENHM